MNMQLTLKSRNAKTGPIPVSTTSKETCPDACPLKNNGCYAEGGPLGILWNLVSTAKPGAKVDRLGNGKSLLQTLTWAQFIKAITNLEAGTLWRHNQAGDLPGVGNKIDVTKLNELVEANQGKRGFTYTHKPINANNKEAIRAANNQGFTINLSANNPTEADTLADYEIGPVVTVLPNAISGNIDVFTPKGRRVVVCPATYRDEVSCATCQLCQRGTRTTIIGFPAHGTSKRKANAIASL